MKNPFCFLLSPLVYILLFVIALSALIPMLGHPRYSENDDIAILADIKAGFRVSFMSSLLGAFFSLLYQNVSDAIPWYSIFIYIFLGINLFILLRILNILNRLNFTEYLVISAIISFFYIRSLLTIGYTETAIMCGGTGILGLFYNFYQNNANWRNALLYGLLLSFCFLWRIQALLFVLVFFFPVLLIKIKKYWIYCIIFLSPCIILYAANALYTHSKLTPEQRYFDEFNFYRGKIHDTNIYELNKNNKKLLENVKWTENDFLMFKRWLFLDENKYNSDILKRLLNSPDLIKKSAYNPCNLRYIFRSAKQIIIVNWKLIVIPIFLCILIFLYSNKKKILLCTLFFIYIMMDASVLASILKFPDRLASPTFFVISSIYAIVLLGSNPSESFIQKPMWQELRKWIVIIFCILLTLSIIIAIIRIDRLNKFKEEIVHSEIKKFEDSINFDSVLLCHPWFFTNYTYINPLREYTEKAIVIPTGWATFSPRFYDVLQKIGLKRGSDVFPYIVKSENAFIIVPEDMKTIINTYIKQNYNIETELKIINTFKNISLSSYDLAMRKISEKPKK